jgi:hypothetical protein
MAPEKYHYPDDSSLISPTSGEIKLFGEQLTAKTIPNP